MPCCRGADHHGFLHQGIDHYCRFSPDGYDKCQKNREDIFTIFRENFIILYSENHYPIP